MRRELARDAHQRHQAKPAFSISPVELSPVGLEKLPCQVSPVWICGSAGHYPHRVVRSDEIRVQGSFERRPEKSGIIELGQRPEQPDLLFLHLHGLFQLPHRMIHLAVALLGRKREDDLANVRVYQALILRILLESAFGLCQGGKVSVLSESSKHGAPQ